jgi:hypothetical protein
VIDIDKEKSSRIEDQELIGEITCTLAEIVTTREGVLKRPLVHPQQPNSKRGFLLIRGEEVSSSTDVVHFSLRALGLEKQGFFSKANPFVTISRATESGDTFQPVYKSDVKKSNLNPIWVLASVPVQTMCNGDQERTLRVEVFSYNRSGRHNLIGSFDTCLAKLLQNGNNTTYDLINAAKQKKKGRKYTNSGVLTVESIKLEKRYTLLDYIRGGYQISLTVGIDFTSSNGDPNNADSLHFRSRQHLNGYQSAIRSVGEILDYYDSDHKYPVYGFGAKMPPYYDNVSHCFNANMNFNDPNVDGIPGILQAYDIALNSVKLHGPTNFSSIIRKVTEEAKENMEDTYQILLMLTDGIISDMEATIEQIVYASTLPMSIIIVGIGNTDFKNMDILDADDEPLVSRGKTMERDIVQFVPYRDFARAHPSVLSAKVLEEIPEQFLGYMRAKGIAPRMRQVDNSIFTQVTQVTPNDHRASAPILDLQDIQITYKV